jgi:hypothetical protein
MSKETVAHSSAEPRIALLTGRALSIEAQTADCLHEWNFDQVPPGALPTQFSIGTLFDGRPAGEWQVLTTDRAKSPPNVLAQLMPKEQNMLIIPGTKYPIIQSGKGCGAHAEKL